MLSSPYLITIGRYLKTPVYRAGTSDQKSSSSIRYLRAFSESRARVDTSDVQDLIVWEHKCSVFPYDYSADLQQQAFSSSETHSHPPHRTQHFCPFSLDRQHPPTVRAGQLVEYRSEQTEYPCNISQTDRLSH